MRSAANRDARQLSFASLPVALTRMLWKATRPWLGAQPQNVQSVQVSPSGRQATGNARINQEFHQHKNRCSVFREIFPTTPKEQAIHLLPTVAMKLLLVLSKSSQHFCARRYCSKDDHYPSLIYTQNRHVNARVSPQGLVHHTHKLHRFALSM